MSKRAPHCSVSSRFGELNQAFFDSTRAQRSPTSIAPEESTPESLKYLPARDVFGLGQLIVETMEGMTDEG